MMTFILGFRLIIIINKRNPCGLFHIYFGLLAGINTIRDKYEGMLLNSEEW